MWAYIASVTVICLAFGIGTTEKLLPRHCERQRLKTASSYTIQNSYCCNTSYIWSYRVSSIGFPNNVISYTSSRLFSPGDPLKFYHMKHYFGFYKLEYIGKMNGKHYTCLLVFIPFTFGIRSPISLFILFYIGLFLNLCHTSWTCNHFSFSIMSLCLQKFGWFGNCILPFLQMLCLLEATLDLCIGTCVNDIEKISRETSKLYHQWLTIQRYTFIIPIILLLRY